MIPLAAILSCTDPDVFLEPEGNKVPPDVLPADFYNGISALVNGRAWIGASERGRPIATWYVRESAVSIRGRVYDGTHDDDLVLMFCFEPATASFPQKAKVTGYWQTLRRVKPPTISREPTFYSIAPGDSIVVEAFHFPDLIRGWFHLMARNGEGHQMSVEGRFYGGVSWSDASPGRFCGG